MLIHAQMKTKNIVVHATRASYLKWKPPIEAAWSWYIWYSEGSKKKHSPTAISRRRRKRDNFNSWFMEKGNNTSKCHVCFSSGRNLPRKARRLLCNESRYKICSSSPRNGACWSPDTGRINQKGTNKGFLILNFLFFRSLYENVYWTIRIIILHTPFFKCIWFSVVSGISHNFYNARKPRETLRLHIFPFVYTFFSPLYIRKIKIIL